MKTLNQITEECASTGGVGVPGAEGGAFGKKPPSKDKMAKRKTMKTENYTIGSKVNILREGFTSGTIVGIDEDDNSFMVDTGSIIKGSAGTFVILGESEMAPYMSLKDELNALMDALVREASGEDDEASDDDASGDDEASDDEASDEKDEPEEDENKAKNEQFGKYVDMIPAGTSYAQVLEQLVKVVGKASILESVDITTAHQEIERIIIERALTEVSAAAGRAADLEFARGDSDHRTANKPASPPVHKPMPAHSSTFLTVKHSDGKTQIHKIPAHIPAHEHPKHAAKLFAHLVSKHPGAKVSIMHQKEFGAKPSVIHSTHKEGVEWGDADLKLIDEATELVIE